MASLEQPKVFDVGSALVAHGRGVAVRNNEAEQAYKEQQRNTLYEIGQRAAAGDMQGARDTAFKGGNVDAGFKIDDRRVANEHKELTAIAGSITAADTPEKFVTALSTFEQRRGLAPGTMTQRYKFEHRESILGEVLGAKEQLELAIKSQKPQGSELERRAIGAGLKPGTPEYQQFMREGGSQKTVSHEVEERKKAVIAQGQDPSSPNMQSFILTGRMPREDQQPLTATDKKAILEADEGVLAAENAIQGLQQAKQLSPNALAGPLASQRGYIGSLAGNEASKATADLDNIITTNALSQLKLIFGGMPTEGERKILLEVQGSVNQPDSVRQGIYDRAITMAQRRLEFNRQRAGEMRGGSFYKPQGQQQRPGSQPQQQGQTRLPQGVTRDQAISEARAAIAQGKDRNAVIQRLQSFGIDPSGL